MRTPERPFLVAAIVLGVLAGPSAGPAGAGDDLEYGVKAVYLVRFAAFVEWPAAARRGADAPVGLCVIGQDPFGPRLDAAARGQRAHGRPLVVRRLAGPAPLDACDIVYVGRGAEPMLREAGDPSGRLIVTDAAASSRRGMIHFVVAEGRVRFHIDLRAASGAGLTISSRLLNLALSVQRR
ncbi:MAG: YfiR family protein [Caulobacter sp.]|nr:YfiR family protein [Caulobacter sp.]